MIREILKPISKSVRTFSSNSYASKKFDPISFNSNSFELSNKAEGAKKIFQEFFKENPPIQQEKSFFDMKFLQQEETMKMDPYQTLGIQTNASMEKINLAFRQLAMKYHPKNDPSKQAEEKFVNIAWAYETLNNRTNTKTDHQISLMKKFNDQIKQFLNNQVGIMKASSKTQLSKSKVKMVELYSETKKVKNFGGQKQVSLEKEYNRDGKLLKITRNQLFNQDGSVQISEILDDGHDIRTVRLYKQKGSSQMKQVRHSQD